MKSGVTRKLSRSVVYALRILQSFDGLSTAQSLSQLSRRLQIPKATAYRILMALEAERYVVRDEQAKAYSLGLGMWELALRSLAGLEIVTVSRPVLSALAQESGETAHLGVLDRAEVVYLDLAESRQPIRAYISRGERLPAYCVASGKAILAYSERPVVEAVIKRGMKRYTARTIVTRKEFLAELQATRERGFGLNLGEWMEEVAALSAPVFKYGEHVVGAIGISGPLSRFESRNLDVLGKIVRAHADRVSFLLGGATMARVATRAAEGLEETRARMT